MIMGMTLDEAIKHAEGVANANKRLCETVHPSMQLSDYGKCAEEHRQLAEWLKELKQLREQTRWIPVSEDLPKENETVISSTKDGVYPETKYTKKYGWEWAYEAGSDYWRELEGVTAWMPLPEQYKEESEVKNEQNTNNNL